MRMNSSTWHSREFNSMCDAFAAKLFSKEPRADGKDDAVEGGSRAEAHL